MRLRRAVVVLLSVLGACAPVATEPVAGAAPPDGLVEAVAPRTPRTGATTRCDAALEDAIGRLAPGLGTGREQAALVAGLRALDAARCAEEGGDDAGARQRVLEALDALPGPVAANPSLLADIDFIRLAVGGVDR